MKRVFFLFESLEKKHKNQSKNAILFEMIFGGGKRGRSKYGNFRLCPRQG